MLYIHAVMLEPATVSIGLYLLTKTPHIINRNQIVIKRNPFLIKRKFCKWVYRNHKTIVDTLIDEGNDYLLNALNTFTLNPSIFMMIYIFALILVILL